jgi:hypothetical protein
VRRARNGPRPATQPAHSNATATVPGTNHVQSTSEWNAKTTTIETIVSSPIRSGS